MNIKLRLANSTDLEKYRDELIGCMDFSLAENENIETPAEMVYEKLKGYFDAGKAQVWLALDSDNLAGYAQFFLKDNGRIHLNEIAVAKEYMGNGVGTLLVEAVESSARECNASLVELFCNELNDRAKRFYTNLHYTTEKRLLIKAIKAL